MHYLIKTCPLPSPILSLVYVVCPDYLIGTHTRHWIATTTNNSMPKCVFNVVALKFGIKHSSRSVVQLLIKLWYRCSFPMRLCYILARSMLAAPDCDGDPQAVPTPFLPKYWDILETTWTRAQEFTRRSSELVKKKELVATLMN
jgi:hypothetical protein